MIEKVPIKQIKENPDNPRTIKGDKYKKLKKSIEDFPEMLELRPLVIDEEGLVLGGNMRLKALKELGYKEVPIIRFNNLDENKKKEFIIKDNLSYGEWDWEVLQTEWDLDALDDWGFEFSDTDFEPSRQETEPEEKEDIYTNKIAAPIYEPSGTKPQISELYDLTHYNRLLDAIDKSNLNEEEKQLLRLTSTRHIKFDYTKIADLYAHSDKELQSLIEDNALIIIDFDKAIELGYAKISDKLIEKFTEEYGDEE